MHTGVPARLLHVEASQNQDHATQSALLGPSKDNVRTSEKLKSQRTRHRSKMKGNCWTKEQPMHTNETNSIHRMLPFKVCITGICIRIPPLSRSYWFPNVISISSTKKVDSLHSPPRLIIFSPPWQIHNIIKHKISRNNLSSPPR